MNLGIFVVQDSFSDVLDISLRVSLNVVDLVFEAISNVFNQVVFLFCYSVENICLCIVFLQIFVISSVTSCFGLIFVQSFAHSLFNNVLIELASSLGSVFLILCNRILILLEHVIQSSSEASTGL